MKNTNFILSYEKDIMANEDIYPNARTELLSDYDLALSKKVLKTALAQMRSYSRTDILDENIALVEDAINNPEIEY